MAYETCIFRTSRGAAFVNIKVAVVEHFCLQKHSFDTEYTIRQLPTYDQHAGNEIF